MDTVADPTVSETVVMKSAQVGWTEIINNIAGYFIDQDPAPMMVVQPTLEMAEAWSTDRLAPMVRDTPRLTAKIADAKSRDSGNKVLQKRFPGGQLVIAGANSPASLASRPLRVVLADEVDRYPASAGIEGDPLTLAYKRTNNFWNRRKLAGSTPTIAGASRIEAKFLESDQRYFFLPCPHCGEHQTLTWGQVRWDKTKGGGHCADTAHYVCEHNGCIWDDADRWGAVLLGEWRATAPFSGIAGFHIWEAYSSWVKLADTVKAFLEAKKSPETYKVWTNTALGLTWVEKGEAPEWQRLYDRREKDMAVGTPPASAGLLVGAVDAQRAGGGRLELDIWAFGPKKQRAFVEHVDIVGSLADRATWDKLDAEVSRIWTTADGRKLRLARVAIDSGDGENTMHVYAWARRHPGFAMAVKGRVSVTDGMPIAGPTWVDVTVNGRKIKKGVRLWTVGTSVLKLELYGHLQLDRPADGGDYPEGFVFLPDGTSDEWTKQLVAEHYVSVKKRTGGVRMEWRQLRDRNEALDNAVYARAVTFALGIDRWSARQWAKALGTAPAPPIKAHVVEPAGESLGGSPPSRSMPPARPRPGRKANPFTSRGR